MLELRELMAQTLLRLASTDLLFNSIVVVQLLFRKASVRSVGTLLQVECLVVLRVIKPLGYLD